MWSRCVVRNGTAFSKGGLLFEPDQKLFNDSAPIALMAADPEYMARVHLAIKTKPRVICDFETRSYLPLGGKESVGAEKYSQHHSTRVICMSFKIGDNRSELWWPFFGEPFPFQLLEAIEDGCIFEAHNAGFERAIWRNIVAKLYGVPCPEHWCDTMAVCAYRAIPMKLDDAIRVLGLPEKKDSRGKLLIRKLCQPQKLLKADKKKGETGLPDKPGYKWNEDPVLIKELGEYCLQDAEAEYGLGLAIGDLPPSEYEVYRLDQEINERGVFIDIDAVRAANKIRLAVEDRLTEELIALTRDPETGVSMVQTGGELESMAKWCAMQGVHLPDMTADTIDLYLNPKKVDPLPPGVKRLLEIRRVLARASAKKLVKFITMLCKNGRIMGMLQYHGAGTGRWAGRGVQPQNFPRPEEWIMEVVKKWSAKKGKNIGDAQASMELLMTCILTEDDEWLECMYGDPMNALANALRGFIIAAPDHELYVADFSAIEARVLAWVAGEQWKLDAFAGIDRGEGYKGSQDIYLATASMVYGYPCIDKTTHGMERQTGKTCVGSDTLVLTDRGFVPILCVRKTDRVWDGEEWVAHGGLLDQGVRETMSLAGVSITPGHKILAHESWLSAVQAVFSVNVLSLALERGSENLPSSSLSFYRPVGSRRFRFNALAAHHLTRSGCTTSSEAKARVATSAPRNRQAIGENNSGDTPTSFLILETGDGFSTASLLASNAAITRKLNATRTTEAGASMSSRHGEKTSEPSSPTLPRSKAGITRRLNSTGRTPIRAISLETFASSRGRSTLQTKERSAIFNDASLRLKNVYDLADAGPRRRFTILTDAGPIIIHNCELAFGYQGGVGAWRKFDDSDKWTDGEVDEKKKAWREAHPMTKTYWYEIEDTAVQAVLTRRPCSYRGVTFQVVKSSCGDWLACRLPNGRCLWYYGPYLVQVPSKYGKFVNGQREKFKNELHYQGKDNKRGGAWGDVKTYGGMLTENIVQAISRDLMCEAMFRVTAADYPIILTVHDEIISERRKGSGGSGKVFNELMSVVPAWTPGLPISVAGYVSERYRKD